MKLKLTESDLHNMISRAVLYTLREGIENSEILSQIVQCLSKLSINAVPGENDLEVPMDENGNMFAYIVYNVNDNRYIEHMTSTYTEPEMGGEYHVSVNEIYIYDEDGVESQINDNGMVANALNNLINVDGSDVGYQEQEY